MRRTSSPACKSPGIDRSPLRANWTRRPESRDSIGPRLGSAGCQQRFALDGHAVYLRPSRTIDNSCTVYLRISRMIDKACATSDVILA